MPRKRTAPRRRRHAIGELDPYLRSVLEGGQDFFNRFTPGQLAEAWEMHGETITDQHIEAHPFTRPCSWWDYDAPEPRRCLEGNPLPMEERPPHFRGYHFGVPAYWGDGDWDSCYETVPDYLARLDLYTDHERRLIESGLGPTGDEDWPVLKIDTREVP